MKLHIIKKSNKTNEIAKNKFESISIEREEWNRQSIWIEYF